MGSISKILKDVFLNSIIASRIIPGKIKKYLYSFYGIKIGKTSRIQPSCFFEGGSIDKVKIGEGVFINDKCIFSCHNNIIIEDNCNISYEVSFCTTTHKLGSEKRRAGQYFGLPIKIGDGTWIGTRAVILPGVTVGNGCVIASGAVVSKDCKPNGLYAGVPAKRIKDLFIEDNCCELIL